MEVFQIQPNPKSLKRVVSLECNCISLNKKPMVFCELCSEKRLLKRLSQSIITDSSSFSDEYS